MNEKRLQTDSLYMDLMMNAFDFGMGEIDIDDFMSAHNFYYSWYDSFSFEDYKFLDFVFAFELNGLVKDYQNKNDKNTESKEILRMNVHDFIETIDFENDL